MAGAAQPVLAQSQTEVEAAEITEITEVIVTATGFRLHPEGLTSNVELISAADLARAPVAGIGDQLAYLPGVRSTAFARGRLVLSYVA